MVVLRRMRYVQDSVIEQGHQCDADGIIIIISLGSGPMFPSLTPAEEDASDVMTMMIALRVLDNWTPC